MIQFKLMERRDMSADWSDCGIYANVDDAITAGDLLHFAISLIDRIARSAAPELEAEAQSKGRTFNHPLAGGCGSIKLRNHPANINLGGIADGSDDVSGD